MIQSHEDDVDSGPVEAGTTCNGCPDAGEPYTAIVDGTERRVRLCMRSCLVLPDGGHHTRPGWCPRNTPKAGHDVP